MVVVTVAWQLRFFLRVMALGDWLSGSRVCPFRVAMEKGWGDLLPVSVCVLAFTVNCSPVLGGRTGTASSGLETASIVTFIERCAATKRLPRTQVAWLYGT